MKRKIILMVAAAVLFLVPSVLGQNTTMYFNGRSEGNNWPYNNETVGTGFYDGSINGVQVGANQPGGPGMVCDDFNHNIYSNETWTANGINASSLNASNIGQTLFGATLGVTQGLQLYTELAYLVNQMFTTNPNAATQAAYSQAIWALTGGVAYSALSTQAQGFYNTAKNMLASGISLAQYTNLWVYTPDPLGKQGQQNQAQEMWGSVAVPEGGAALAYLVLAGLSCYGAMFFRSKWQTSARGSA